MISIKYLDDCTSSQGKRNKRNHLRCIRCGKISWHKQRKRCGACGYPEAKIRRYNWGKKATRRRTTGTGRTQHLKDIHRSFDNGFIEQKIMKARKVRKGAKKVEVAKLEKK